MSRAYKDSTERKYRLMCEDQLKELPDFCTEFYRTRLSLSASSHYTYLNKIKSLLTYLHDEVSAACWKAPIKEYAVEDLANLTQRDATTYINWLSTQLSNRSTRYDKVTLSKNFINSHICSLSAYWAFYKKRGDLKENIWRDSEKYKLPKKEVLSISDAEQRQNYMESVVYGNGLSNREMKFHEKTKIRDIAIVKILFSTGIRVSELVGLDVDDVHLERSEPAIFIVTKRDKEKTTLLPDSCVDVLGAYLEYRETLKLPEENKALFVSTQGRTIGNRLSVRSVELMIKKYAMSAGVDSSNKITPHRIRATVAQVLLEQTGDIAIAKEVLNHESIATTEHYLNTGKLSKARAREVLDEI